MAASRVEIKLWRRKRARYLSLERKRYPEGNTGRKKRRKSAAGRTAFFEEKIGQRQRVSPRTWLEKCLRKRRTCAGEISNKTSQKAGPVNIVWDKRSEEVEKGRSLGTGSSTFRFSCSRVVDLERANTRGGTKIGIFVTSRSSKSRTRDERKDIVTDWETAAGSQRRRRRGIDRSDILAWQVDASLSPSRIGFLESTGERAGERTKKGTLIEFATRPERGWRGWRRGGG